MGRRQNNYIAIASVFLVILAIFVVGFVIFKIVEEGKSDMVVQGTTYPTPTASGLSVEDILAPEPSATIAPVSKTYPFEKSFDLEIKDGQGTTVGTVKYLVKTYELTNKVTVNNYYNGLLKEHRELLVFHVEITNDTNLAFNVFAGDKIRLLKGTDTKLIAPDFPKDSIDVRPKSTVETGVGFIVDKNGEALSIHLGEQDGGSKTIAVPRN